jgi:undecaprenyl-phosphate 4-deoxy-4-formamido-L-arabinose transferase
VDVSIVVPVFNEEKNLPLLHQRLTQALEKLGKNYEIILVDDGSSDGSKNVLKEIVSKDSHVQILFLTRNFGQHGAVIAGFKKSTGDIVITLDGDLQNPPEEIPKLISKMEEGFDVVGGIRQHRQDSLFRKISSFITNHIASTVVGKKMFDCGCMLRAYRRQVILELLEYNDVSIFIPALTASIADRFVEIPVRHEPRHEGKSKYHLFRLMTIYFDLITGYSPIPIQLVTLFGIFSSVSGFIFIIFVTIRRFVSGPELTEGLFAMVAILVFFMGQVFLVLGLIGEYISRIYLEIRKRPKFLIKEHISRDYEKKR